MEDSFTPKVEETEFDDCSIHIKDEEEEEEEEEYSEESFSSLIIKKEEEMSQSDNAILDSISLMRQTDQRFDQIFESLNQYLDHFVDVEDFELPSTVERDAETEKIISEAKVHFKEWGSEIIRNLTQELKKKGVHHTFPESYLVQVVESTKRRIFTNYKQLKRNFIETLTHDIRPEKHTTKETGDKKTKKGVRKNKHGFPPEAQALLRCWFISHAKDPYPSHEEKIELARTGGISMKQLNNWLINNRRKIWKQTQQNEPKFDKQIASVLLCKTEDFLKIEPSE